MTCNILQRFQTINTVWVTPDVDVRNACAMPIGYGIGNHRAFIIDFSTPSLVGIDPQTILCPAAWRLNTKIPNCSAAYNQIIEAQVTRHSLLEKLQHKHSSASSPSILQKELDSIDKIISDCMRHAEHHCHGLKSGRTPFSPKASLWI